MPDFVCVYILVVILKNDFDICIHTGDKLFMSRRFQFAHFHHVKL